MYLGIDIGGTFIKYGLVNEDYQVIKNEKKKPNSLQHQMHFMIIYVKILI